MILEIHCHLTSLTPQEVFPRWSPIQTYKRRPMGLNLDVKTVTGVPERNTIVKL